VVSEPLRQDLELIGIRAEVIPLPPRRWPDAAGGWPRPHSILSYIPQFDAAHYGLDGLLALAHALPSIPITVVGHRGNGLPKLPNITWHGWVDDARMQRLYWETAVLVRLPRHDGLPKMLLESLAAGLQAFWIYPFPFCRTASGIEDVLPQLRHWETAGVPRNAGARDYVMEQYAGPRFSERFALALRPEDSASPR
jgi:hypothetical protein